MNIHVTTADGSTRTYECTQWMTDEHNNLCVVAGTDLRALFAADCWRSAVVEEE